MRKLMNPFRDRHIGDCAHVTTLWRIHKYQPGLVADLTDHLGFEPKYADLVAAAADPYAITEIDGNLMTTVGLNRLTNLLIGGGGVAMSHANCALGTGDSTTAAAIGDTQLTANSTSHSRYIPADATFPTQVNGLVSVNATFGSADGNYVAGWQEFGIVVCTTATASDTFAGSGTSPVLLNHKVAAAGVKVSGAIWVAQGTLTLN